MSDLSETLQSICKDAKDSVCTQAADLIDACRQDETQLLRDIGEQAKTAVQSLAAGKIDADMFKDLMDDATSLQKIEVAKLSVQSKVRAQKTIETLRNLLIDGICKLIK